MPQGPGFGPQPMAARQKATAMIRFTRPPLACISQILGLTSKKLIETL
jgi:hypothetical protein